MDYIVVPAQFEWWAGREYLARRMIRPVSSGPAVTALVNGANLTQAEYRKAQNRQTQLESGLHTNGIDEALPPLQKSRRERSLWLLIAANPVASGLYQLYRHVNASPNSGRANLQGMSS
jgi:hypothetical protein